MREKGEWRQQAGNSDTHFLDAITCVFTEANLACSWWDSWVTSKAFSCQSNIINWWVVICVVWFCFLYIIFNLFIFERQSTSGGGAEREWDTESEADSRIWAVTREPDVGLELTNREIMTWAEVRHLTDWATQAPHDFIF